MKTLARTLVLLIFGIMQLHEAVGRPYNYPAIRYINTAGNEMGGVVAPIADEVGNSLFNNPAALARNTKFKAEYLNLNLESDAGLLSGVGLSTTKMTSLGGMIGDLNAHAGTTYAAGLVNLTALSWGGLAVGLMFQEQAKAVSNGTTVQYDTVSQFIPAAGYGLALARGVVRLGYSLQYVSQAYGTANTAATNTSASFLDGINEGRGLSHTMSANFVFPFTYLPTFTIVGRNLFGTHFVAGSMFGRAKNPIGITPDEPMSVDLAFNMTIRISGAAKSHWYFQYKDITSAYSIPFLDRMSFGAEIGFSEHFNVRAGLEGTQWSAGIGYKSTGSEINLGMYHEPVVLTGTDSWDTRFGLQYKIYFQDANTRDRDGEAKAKQ
ncbi:MAG: hypothetical protein JST80_12545 [Bdellovibrionales bacterium]|nr:hypothetical protein [Bdellovibrionales bacterium]